MTEEQEKFELLPSMNFESFQGEDALAESQAFLNDRALQQVKTSYTTAVSVQRPRSIEIIAKNVITESRLAGASFYYRWPVKDKRSNQTKYVQGASIDLAMCIARNYGNCAVEIESQENKTHYLLKGIFIDLETGFTVPRLFRQRKSQSIGRKYDQERAEDIVFQIAQSKAQRNAILKAMPAWLIEKAIDVARQAEISKIKPENIVMARAAVLDFFAGYGVTPDRIEEKIGVNVDGWTSEDIADLRASATALKEGRISPNELFPTPEGLSEESKDLADRILKGEKTEPEKQPDETPPDAGSPDLPKEEPATKTSPFLSEEQTKVARMNQILADNDKQPINPERLDQFLKYTAKQYGYTATEIIDVAKDKIDNFLKSYEKWLDEVFFHNKETTDEPEQSHEDKIRNSDAYLNYNPDSEAPQKRYNSKAKILKIKDELKSWPDTDPKFLETAKIRELHQYLLKKIGKDKETDADQGGEHVEVEIIYDLTETEEWQQLIAISKKHPDEYKTVMQGKSPKTVEDLKDIIKEIELVVMFDDQGIPIGR